MSDNDQELDARGLNCPLPILRAKKTLNGMGAGALLKIIATILVLLRTFRPSQPKRATN